MFVTASLPVFPPEHNAEALVPYELLPTPHLAVDKSETSVQELPSQDSVCVVLAPGGISPAKIIEEGHPPDAPVLYFAVLISETSVQDDPSQVSTLPTIVDGPVTPPTAIAAV